MGDDGFSNALGDAGAVYLLNFADTNFGSPTLLGTLGSGYTGVPSDFSVGELDGANGFGASV
ncbi:hypothetical protein, partial [Erythrobacter donghaensis]|uniref:hypothetical protein n=1 Tax=Erythrobacter donghaensis TaxID=267135 RepID=UPI0012D99091